MDGVTSFGTEPQTRDWPAWRCPIDLIDMRMDGQSLVCGNGHSVVVRDGIPRFVDTPTYADAFGEQWSEFPQTQLDSVSGIPLSAERAERCMGRELWSDLDGLHVLEAGCGAGRFTEVLLDRGAFVTSLDLTNAVDANAANFPPGPRHRIAAADIWRLPFAPRQFDVVFCLGVVQHTPNPETTIAFLYEQVKPGGWLVFDHYTFDIKVLTKVAFLLRPLVKRLSPEKGIAISRALVAVFLPLHRRVRRYRILQILLSRVSPITSYYQYLPDLSEEQQREWAVLDTHDGLTDWYKHLRTRRQLVRTLEQLGAKDIYCERAVGITFEVRARRPG